MKESTLTTNILKALRGECPDGFWFKVHGGPYQQAGLPDIMGIWMGLPFGIEVKLPGRPHPLTDLQRHTLKAMRNAGGYVTVVDTVEGALDFVRGDTSSQLD